MKTLSFTVSIPTDNGFVGRKCPNARCGKYFKVHKDVVAGKKIHCAYCGTHAKSDSFTTINQEKYITAQLQEHAVEHASKLIDKHLSKMARNFKGGGFVSMNYKPSRYKAKKIRPRYTENKVDSELQCPTCDTEFQVYGIFGYCPGCSAENMMIYDANITIIRNELKAAMYSDRALRHAYGDIVSAFEQFCERYAPTSAADTKTNFQDLFETRRAFKKARGIDILAGLDSACVLALRRVFQKRHVYTHDQGIVNEKYTKKIPEDVLLLGKKAPLSEEEFETAIVGFRAVADQILSSRRLVF